MFSLAELEKNQQIWILEHKKKKKSISRILRTKHQAVNVGHVSGLSVKTKKCKWKNISNNYSVDTSIAATLMTVGSWPVKSGKYHHVNIFVSAKGGCIWHAKHCQTSLD